MRTILATLGFVLSLSAGPIYDVANLGNLGGKSAVAFDISNGGGVAGSGVTTAGQAFAAVWDGVDSSLVGLGASADAINLFGAVVGTSTIGGVQRATVWENGGVRHLAEGDASVGLGINDAGHITGSLVRGTRASAFVQRLGELVEISTPGVWSSAYDINNAGAVTGYYQDGGTFRAFTWSESEGVRTLGTLGGGSSYGMALNDSGVVVGSSFTRSGYLHAFLYDGIMRDLGTLGGKLSAAYSVNAAGSAVGYSYDALGRQRAFVWQNGTMFDLNALIDPSSGWTLEAAYGINDLGQIVGHGLYGGARVAFALNPLALADEPVPGSVDTPEPATGALLFAALAMFASGQVIRRRRG